MKKILVVEDVDLNRELIVQLLEDTYQVIEAVNGQEGLELAELERPDLILMDLSLPVMDGWEATRRLKAHDDLRSIPIIALTARAMVGDEERARKAGCDGYLAKPIDTRNFLQIIAKYLNGDSGDGQKAENSKQNPLTNKHRILIVDDDPLNVKLLSTAFCPEEYLTLTAYGGEEALEKVVKELPDLILLDIMMPGVHGIEVLRQIKRISPDVKAIMITAVNDEQVAKEAMDLVRRTT